MLYRTHRRYVFRRSCDFRYTHPHTRLLLRLSLRKPKLTAKLYFLLLVCVCSPPAVIKVRTATGRAPTCTMEMEDMVENYAKPNPVREVSSTLMVLQFTAGDMDT